MKIRLLVVDDEADIREMLARHFRFLGLDVFTAANGRAALDILRAEKIDIVISDIMMPEMNGIELLRALRAEYPMVHSIMITGYVTLDNALACMRLGADTLIFKPIEDLKQLEDAVENSVHALRHWVDLLKQLQTMKPQGV
jgi:CheY-like chemotaxis protein